MGHNTNPERNSEFLQSMLWRTMKIMPRVGLILFALIWMSFGLFLFFLIHTWDIEYNRKMAMIDRGEVNPVTLIVLGVSEDKNNGGWKVSLGPGGKAVAWRTISKKEQLHTGDSVIAYRFDDNYLIPQVDGGFGWGKWAFFTVGLMPIVIIGSVMLFRVLCRLRQDPTGDY
jgi:hypothetical protein